MQRFATTSNTRTLFTIARRDRDSRSYSTLGHVCSERDAIGWMTHSGVEQRVAAELVRNAHSAAFAELHRQREAAPSSSALLALPRAIDGDMIDAVELGPRGESFRIIGTIVSAPGVPA